MISIENKKITIIGAQRSGIAAAELVIKNNGKAKISDTRKISDFPEDVKKQIESMSIACQFGEHSRDFIEDSDIIVLSPGVRIDSAVVEYAKEKNILVMGEIEFAYQFCNKPVIAITGSNGKTTVSTLISKVFDESGKKACLCGNVGLPFSKFVVDGNNYDFFVLEVSSFQMESLVSEEHSQGFELKLFSPNVAVLLNFSQNHLDRHKDMEEYFQAKMNVFKNQNENSYAVINSNVFKGKNLDTNISSKIVYFDQVVDSGFSENQQAVFSVATVLGIEQSVCETVFSEFKGVEHRLELVKILNGVAFVNDSKATTVESGKWALGHLDKPVVMICGGRDKNLDFLPLKDLVSNKVKHMIVIGEASGKIENAFKDVVKVNRCNTLDDAVLKSQNEAISGDCVLLSPMCASFDMFDNYEQRGKVFKELVSALK